MSANCISINKLSSRFDSTSYVHTKPNGITVKQLIGELKKYNPEDKVYMYDSEGDLYNVVRIMKDKSKLVAF